MILVINWKQDNNNLENTPSEKKRDNQKICEQVCADLYNFEIQVY